MEDDESGRDFGLPAQYNNGGWRPTGDLFRAGPGSPVEVVDGNSAERIGLA